MEKETDRQRIEGVLTEVLAAEDKKYVPHSSYEIVRRCYQMDRPCCAAYSKRISELRHLKGYNIFAMKSPKNPKKHWFLVLPSDAPMFIPNINSPYHAEFNPYRELVQKWDDLTDANK